MERGEEKLSKYERENLLIKLDKEFAFAGVAIPVEIEAEGERIKLRSFVFEMSQRRGSLDPEGFGKIDAMIARLRKKKQEIIRRIAAEDIDKDEAMELYHTALGLRRALDTLYSATEPKTSVEEESKKAMVEDMRRWLGLVRRIYAKEEKRRRE